MKSMSKFDIFRFNQFRLILRNRPFEVDLHDLNFYSNYS